MTQHWPDLGHGDDDAIDAAAKWFARSQRGLSPKDRAALLTWLKAAPENVAAMDIVSQAWTNSSRIAGRSAFETTSGRWSARRRANSTEHRSRRRRLIAATMASAMTCAAFAAIAWIGTSVDQTYRSSPGQLLTVTLSDGSHLKLAPSTSLHVRMDPLHRSVSLETGEAEFDVTHNRVRPFLVTTRELAIRDVGTRFAVRNRAQPVRVVLIEGVVDVLNTSSGQRVRLAPGEEATVRVNGLEVKKSDLSTSLAWSEGRLVFEDFPLDQALDEWRAQKPVDFYIVDPKLNRLKISGTYSTSDVIAFLNGLSRVDSISWHETSPNRFELRSAGHGS